MSRAEDLSGRLSFITVLLLSVAVRVRGPSTLTCADDGECRTGRVCDPETKTRIERRPIRIRLAMEGRPRCGSVQPDAAALPDGSDARYDGSPRWRWRRRPRCHR